LLDQLTTTTTTTTTVMFYYVRLSAAAAALTTVARSSSLDSRRRPAHSTHTQSDTRTDPLSEYVSRLHTTQLKFSQWKVVPETTDHVEHNTQNEANGASSCLTAHQHKMAI